MKHAGKLTRERVLDVAERLFAQKGFDAASIRDIAKKAGVNKSLVHYYFENKLDMFNQLAELYLKRTRSFTTDFFSSLSVNSNPNFTFEMRNIK